MVIKSVEFYANIKEEQELIQTIRKDYDSLVASTQKNTYELRSLVDSIKKNNDIVEGIAARV